MMPPAFALISEAGDYLMTPQAPPRIPPLDPPYTPEIADLLRRYMPPDVTLDPLNLFRTLAVHDELASRMRRLGAGILAHGRIDPRDREIVIHRTCARAGAEYEWGVHAVVYGKPLGLTDAQLAATVHGDPGDPAWTDPADRDLVELADQLHDSANIDDRLWTALASRFSSDQLLELVITAGWYRLISYVVNATRVQPEPWAARFPALPTAETWGTEPEPQPA
jgi:alkylhydroperoxidase family enzyme